MDLIRKGSIKQKLMKISMLTTCIALLLTSVLLIANEVIVFRQSLIERIGVMAKTIGTNSTAALIFNDQKTAEETLSALKSAQSITCAVLYNRKGGVLAQYIRDVSAGDCRQHPVGPDGYHLGTDYLDILQRINLDNESIGTLYIRSDLKEIYHRIQWYAVTVFMVMMLSIVIAFLLMSRLQKIITKPLSDMADVMYTISGGKNYSVRVAIQSQDEVGILGEGFNEMLSQIQKRDTELKLHREHLEEMIGIRTSELARTTNFLENIFNSSLDGIITTDVQGNILYTSPRIKDILGYEPNEVLGKEFHMFFARSLEESEKIMDEVMSKGEIRAYELRSEKKSGEAIDLNLAITLLRDEKGEVIGTTSIYRDITVEKRMAADVEQAMLRAEAANRAKSEFLANMSHEIRTPMNGVIGMTGLLLDTELNEEQRQYANIAYASGESLLRLINDILDFSKIEAGKLELETLDFDLRALLDDFAAMMAERVQGKGLEFICAAATDVPSYLRGDPGRLRQVLTNLAGNAVKFTHQGEIAVRVNLVSETEAEAVVRFSVKDTGIGVPADKKGILFQKFTQADASTTRKYGGTGLGLAISKQLAEMMGGEIGIESEGGRGSEFWFTVRLAKQHKLERIEVPSAVIRGAHILVVDDNATNREVLAAQLRNWGVRSEEVPDGPSALQSLYRARDAGDPFQAAILDMQMPGMDGETLGRVIKIDEKLKNTRLVMMTSIGQRGDAKLMEEVGFAAYLIKPVRQADLFEVLSVVLAGESVPRAAQPLVTRHSIRELRRGAVRILLAEDNVTNQEVALGILKKLGLRADAVANGAEAVKSLETLPYDLVLMDVQMPVMDGLSATRIIRDPQSAVRNHHIPVIAMTAYAMKGDREKCLEAGMNDYVSKPVEPQALADMLEKWLPKDKAVTQEQTPVNAKGTLPVSVPEPEAQVFDKAGVMVRLMYDEDLARKVIGRFMDDTPKRIEVLRGHIKAGEAPSAERQAHTIKGASATCGGEALRAVALKMEEAARAGDLESVAARLPELDMQFIRLKEAMNGFINQK